MAFNAGEVYAVLGAKVNTSGFAKYDAAMNGSAAKAEAFEKKHTAAMKRSQASATAFGNVASKALAGGFIAAGVAAASSVKKYADFEQTLNVLKATANATDRQMVQVRKTAVALGNDMSLPATSAKDAADAMTELAKGGLTVTQTMKAAKGVLQLSAAAQISNAEAATIVADNLNAFNLKAQESVKVADLLAAAANATTASIPEMGDALKQSAAVAHQFKIPIGDLVTMLGELANRGIKGSDAGTSVKTMLQSLIPSSTQAAAAMDKMNIKVFDQQGHFRGMPAVIGQFNKALSQMTQEQQAAALKTIFGSDAVRAANVIFGSSSQAFDKLRDKMTQQGAAADLAAAQTKGLNGAWEALKSQVETIQISIGEKLTPAVTTASREVAKFLGELQSGQGAGGQFGDTITSAADSIRSDLTPAIDEANRQIAQIKAEFSGAGQDFAAVGNALEGAFGFLASGTASEVTSVISSIGSGVRAVGDIVRAVGQALRGDFSGAWSSIKAAANNAMQGVVQAVTAVTAPIRQVGSALSQPFRAAADTILGMFSSILSAGAKVVGAMAGIPGIGGAFKGMATGIKAAANEIDGLRAGLREVKPPPPIKAVVEMDAARAALKQLEGTKIGNKVVRVLAEDGSARSKIKALVAMGIPPKTARVLAEVGQALAGVQTVQGALNRLQSKSIQVTVTQAFRTVGKIIPGARAAGRGPGSSETALVGEGRVAREAIVDPTQGWSMLVNGPMVMDLPDTAYVIPQDPAYRGRAMGLLAGLAGDLGLQGFDKGRGAKKKAAKKKRYVPSHLDPLAFDEQTFSSKEQAARTALNDAKKITESEPKAIDATQAQIRDIQRRNPKSAQQKANKADDLKRARAKLKAERQKLKDAREQIPKLRAEWQERKKELDAAKRNAAELTRQQNLADTAADDMALADRRDDQAGYDAAKKRRDAALGVRRTLLAKAKALAEKAGNTNYAAELGAQLSKTDVDIAANTDSTMDVPDADLTAAQKALLAGDQKDIALAALTADLGDDTAAAGKLVGDLQTILSSLTSGGQPSSDSLITDIAGQLKSARENLASLTGGGGSNDNPDLQAQIDQTNAEKRTAAESARINAQALATFMGYGDIGSGAPNAIAAARGPSIIFQSYVPPSPDEARRLADYTVGGMALQPARTSSTERIGW